MDRGIWLGLACPLVMLMLLGGACAGRSASAPPASGAPSAAPGGSAGAPATPDAPPLRPLATPSGTCPDPSRSGLTPMTSAGHEREVIVLTPPLPREGLPLVFVWHGLGATAKSMVPRLLLRELAAAGAVVVVPQAHPEADIGWGWTKDREDLQLFDDLRACLHRDLGVDLERVSSAGFSAGGLWSTYLAIHRGDALATVIEMSGGVLPPILPYSSPTWRLPFLLFDGGRRDTYRAGPALIHFDRNTARLRDRLRADGHLAVHCPHGRGHAIPTVRAELIHRWALGHRYGVGSPWEGQAAPSGCGVE